MQRPRPVDPLLGTDCFTRVQHYYKKGHEQVQRALELDETGAPSIKEYEEGLALFSQAINVPIPGNGENQTKARNLKEKVRRNISQIRGRIDDLKESKTKEKAKPMKKKPVRPPPARPVGRQSSSPKKGPEKLSIPGVDTKMIERILGELLTADSSFSFDKVIGNEPAKQGLRDIVLLPAIRPDLFTGLLAPTKGLLLYGPPGNGKTLLVKALAAEMPDTNFFSISASSLTSKWVGEGEKMVKALFAVARYVQPTVIFIDEIDSLLTARSDSSSDALRRLQTEFLVQFDGAATSAEDRVTVIGATNLPHELDEAVLRRFPKRILIPLPNREERYALLKMLLKQQPNKLTDSELKKIASQLSGYSSSDVTHLAKDAAMAPLRELSSAQVQKVKTLRHLRVQDFVESLQRIRPSTTQATIAQLNQWTESYGQQ